MAVCVPGHQWPSEWSVSYLCLLPKTDQALDSVGKMRPISLLHPLGKSFAGLLMGRVREDISRCMQPYPQYAYLAGRSTADAVDRAFWHVCKTQARTGQQFTLHHRRAGHAPKAFLGSITPSVDLSKAFDSISRAHIRSSLEWAGIPTRVIDVILGTSFYDTQLSELRLSDQYGHWSGCAPGLSFSTHFVVLLHWLAVIQTDAYPLGRTS